MSLVIPEDYIEFLHWVKERTESFWSKDPATSTDDFVCAEWVYGAKWMGLTDTEIDDVEKRYNVQFTSEHRAFLRVLHAIDKKKVVEYVESFDDDAEVLYGESPYFFNWNADEEEIRYRLDYPYNSILDDVMGVNKVWLKSWGEVRPKSDAVKKQTFSNWFKRTTKLIPLKNSCYALNDHSKVRNPILSVYGSDMTVRGWDMRHFLVNELREHLNLLELVFNKELDDWYSEPVKEAIDIIHLGFQKGKDRVIPVWEEMILYWSSGWTNYGKEYPHPKEGAHPIVRTFIAQDEEL